MGKRKTEFSGVSTTLPKISMGGGTNFWYVIRAENP